MPNTSRGVTSNYLDQINQLKGVSMGGSSVNRTPASRPANPRQLLANWFMGMMHGAQGGVNQVSHGFNTMIGRR